MPRMTAVYHLRCRAASVEARAGALAIEQSVEMPIEAIIDEAVLREIVGRVENITEISSSLFEVQIGLSIQTTGFEPGQMLNMLFGNTSLQEDVTLLDAIIPEDLAVRFGGPNLGIDGLRTMCGASSRALTCTALKPQGLGAPELARLAGKLAGGGIDFIKDDHGLADQSYSPFAERVRACGEAVRHANSETGCSARYVPNVTGSLDNATLQVRLAAEEGIEAVLIEPMLMGVSNFQALTKSFPEIAFFAHPSMAGASRIAPPLLLGKLFRLFGADVTVFPNFGGRFSYSRDTCKKIAENARGSWATRLGAPGIKSCFPAPAGGMIVDRVPELLEFYGTDTIFLIGGALLSAGEKLTDEAAAFANRVARHQGGHHG